MITLTIGYQMRKYRNSILLFTFLLVFSLSIVPDDRTENLDVFVVLDKSLSMKNVMDEVKSYIQEYIIDQQLIPGDMFVLLAFYGDAEVVINEQRVGEDRSELTSEVSSIRANGRFTDIANALDTLRQTLENYGVSDRRRYLLLLTDGIQEAPPASKYYTENGSFTHEFLTNVKTIQKEGWKIQILGIGTQSAAKEIAEQLTGEYAETSESPTKEELVEKTQDLLGTIAVKDGPHLSPVDENGNAVLSFTLESRNYSTEKTLTIKDIMLELPDYDRTSILSDSVVLTIPTNATRSVDIPVMVPIELNPGTYTGTISFTFTGEGVFIPAIVDISVKVNTFWENNIWIFPVGAVVFIVLVVLIILSIKRLAVKKGIKLRIYVDSTQLTKEPVSMKPEEPLFLDLERTELSISEEKTDKSVARLTLSGKVLSFSVFESAWIKVSEEIPEHVLGKKVRITVRNITRTVWFKAV